MKSLHKQIEENYISLFIRCGNHAITLLLVEYEILV